MTATHASDPVREASAAGFASLTAWAAGTRFTAIPAVARRRIALVIGDNLAAMLAAEDEPELRAAHEQAIRRSRVAESTLFRSGSARIDRREAALANGLASTWAELDDGYSKAPSHPGAYSQPALLAEAEAEGMSLETTLRAAVLAYEIAARIARTWSSVVPPIHPHALYNTPATAAAIGLARGFDGNRLLQALSAASTLVGPGPYAHAMEGALVRNAWPALGALAGMQVCDWAQAGIGGLATSPFDVYAGSFGAATHPAQLTERLGDTWAVCESYHKRYGCCQQAHAAIEAVETIVAAHPEAANPEEIAAIAVAVPEGALHLDSRDPPTTLAARFSLPHAVAAALVTGADRPEAFGADALRDPRIMRLRQLVTLEPYRDVKPWPLDRPGEVAIMLRSGARFEVTREAALGSPSRPMSESMLLEKIARLSARAAPALASAIETLATQAERDDASLQDSTRAWIRGVFRT